MLIYPQLGAFLFEKKIQFHLNNWGISTSDPLVCLVSGGVDSMVLLYVLWKLSFKVSALHFNFHLRGEESNRDQKFVEDIMQKWGIPLEVVDSPLEKGAGVQERARKARLDYIFSQADKKMWRHVATGHQVGDQLETLLMRLMRGTGPRGFCGILPIKVFTPKTSFIRPLLDFTREEILSYAKSENISFVTDSTNLTSFYFRNWVRHQLLPHLRRKKPHLPRKLLTLAAQCQKVFPELEKDCDTFLENHSQTWIVTRDYLLLSRVLRFFVLEAKLQKEGFHFLSQRLFEELDSLIARKRILERPVGSLFLRITPDHFGFFKSETEKKEAFFIPGPGVFYFEDFSLQVEEFNSLSLSEIKKRCQKTIGFKPLFLKKDTLSYPLELRTPKEGERFKPLGAPGSKKISDYLIDKKVPFFDRKNLLALIQKEKIVALIGYEVEDDYKVQNFEEAILCILKHKNP